MNIFIDTISNPAKLIIFNNNRDFIDETEWSVKGNESSTLIPKIDEILKKNNIKYTDLENLLVVNGPGSFTGIRTTVLAINSINYIINGSITAISYFDLFNNYPIIKSSSKRDYFAMFEPYSKIEIIENDQLINNLNKLNINTIYGEADKNLFKNIKIIENIDYLSIIKNIKFSKDKQIYALYIKKPNIS
ncbi:MAG: hypothetical protein Q8K30_04850 [Candidatus Gracilibacteria bacterium]|nr:hypothetical protein [Candidatus Gracilibacteria bacterium]